MPCHATSARHAMRGRVEFWRRVSKDTRFWACRGQKKSLEGLQTHTITARSRTCRPMPIPGPLVPFSTRWRERDRWHRWGIGGTYRKSPRQMSRELVKDGSAPSLVTPHGRHLNRAAIQKEAKFGVLLKEHPRTKNAPVGHCCPQTTSGYCLEPPLFNLNRN